MSQFRRLARALPAAALPAAALPAAALPLLAAAPALAHTGVDHQHSFLTGLEHPVFGWDHLLAMVAVGLWAGVAGGRALWAWPAAFLLGMGAGGLLGFAGLELPAVEPLILASVFAFGLATCFAIRPPVALAAAAVVLLGTLHGNAHGLEAPADGSGLGYAAGFLLATAALHGTGVAMAWLARRQGSPWLARALGLGVALGGVALAAT